MNTKTLLMIVLFGGIFVACTNKETSQKKEDNNMEQALNLTKEWDKTFPKSNKVEHKKVTFRNRYGITLAADMYTAGEGQFAAIAVCGPFGAVKEQCRAYSI